MHAPSSGWSRMARSLRMALASMNHAMTRNTLLIATARGGSPIRVVTKISPGAGDVAGSDKEGVRGLLREVTCDAEVGARACCAPCCSTSNPWRFQPSCRCAPPGGRAIPPSAWRHQER